MRACVVCVCVCVCMFVCMCVVRACMGVCVRVCSSFENTFRKAGGPKIQIQTLAKYIKYMYADD